MRLVDVDKAPTETIGVCDCVRLVGRQFKINTYARCDGCEVPERHRPDAIGVCYLVVNYRYAVLQS
jgi:hypothetical protein